MYNYIDTAIMKKLFLAFVLALGFGAVASPGDTYAHDASVLPQSAQSTISANFKSKVSVVKIEKDFGRVSEYEVTLSDGCEISFDRHGNWKNVEVNAAKSVPAAIVPQGIKDYVSSKHAGQRIVGIEKERNGYDIELSNGVDIKFNKEAQFVRYDD